MCTCSLFLSLSDVNGEAEEETGRPSDFKVLYIKMETASLLSKIIHFWQLMSNCTLEQLHAASLNETLLMERKPYKIQLIKIPLNAA